jgi:hypothetical protein
VAYRRYTVSYANGGRYWKYLANEQGIALLSSDVRLEMELN